MNLHLPPELSKVVREALERREFATPLEVVREGLRLVEDRQRWRDDVEAKIAEGLAQIEVGDVLDGAEVMARLRERIESRLRPGS